jgi:hypothetical protein
MSLKEKGSSESRPIPIVTLAQGCSESNPSLLILQVSRLTRRCGVDAGMAETLAPMVFGVLS